MIVAQLRGQKFTRDYNGKHQPEFPNKAVAIVYEVAEHLGYNYQDSYYMEYGEHFPGAFYER